SIHIPTTAPSHTSLALSGAASAMVSMYTTRWAGQQGLRDGNHAKAAYSLIEGTILSAAQHSAQLQAGKGQPSKVLQHGPQHPQRRQAHALEALRAQRDPIGHLRAPG